MFTGSSRFPGPDGPVEPPVAPSTRSRVPPRPTTHDSPAARVRAVARAFKNLERANPGLTVGIKGSMTGAYRVEDPERGVVLAFCPEPGSAEVQLQVGPRGGRLVARSSLKGAAGGAGELEDHLRLDLRRGYRWGGIEYTDAETFAMALLAHMRRRHAAVGQVEPVKVETDHAAPSVHVSVEPGRQRLAGEMSN